MNLDYLKSLCLACGISGNEDQVRDMLRLEAEKWADHVEQTASGNLIAVKHGKNTPKKKLMLAAHMDEVGMIVTHICPDGLLKFACVGGIDKKVLSGIHVKIDGQYGGVIGIKPIHLTDKSKRGEVPEVEGMFIDIGADSREEAQRIVAPGSTVCFKSAFRSEGGMLLSKALDDRVGCAIMMQMLQSELPYDMTFAFTVQEEVGLRGAQTAAFKAAPDCALILETTTALDLPEVPEGETVCRLGAGPVVPFMDRASIYDKGYYRLAMDTAAELGIPCQTKHVIAGGNDSGAIQKSRGGVHTCTVSLPCRYLHSPVTAAYLSDLEAMERLVPALAEKMAAGEG